MKENQKIVLLNFNKFTSENDDARHTGILRFLFEALLFSIPSLSVGNPKSSNSVIIKKCLVKNCKDLKSFENYLNHYLKMTDSQIEDLKIKFRKKSSKTDYRSSLVNLVY